MLQGTDSKEQIQLEDLDQTMRLRLIPTFHIQLLQEMRRNLGLCISGQTFWLCTSLSSLRFLFEILSCTTLLDFKQGQNTAYKFYGEYDNCQLSQMVFLPCIRIHNNQILRLLQESLFAIFLFFADLRIWSHLLIS